MSAAAATLPTEARADDALASLPEVPVTMPAVDAAVLPADSGDAIDDVVSDALGDAEQAAAGLPPTEVAPTPSPATPPAADAAPVVEPEPAHVPTEPEPEPEHEPDTMPVPADTAGGIDATAVAPTSAIPAAAIAAQTAPSNLNVSVRIGSPGDNGPVTQVNVAASSIVPSGTTAPTTAAGTTPGTPNGSTPAHAAAGAPSTAQDDPDTWSWQWNCLSMPDLSVIPPVGSTSGSVPRNWTWIWNCGENSTQYQDATSAQYQPSNVNIAIRISSPGNDGPVTQANVAVATRAGSVTAASSAAGSVVILPVPVQLAAATGVLSDAVIPGLTSLESTVAPAEPIWLGDDVSLPAAVESIVELPQMLSPLLGFGATGAGDREWPLFSGRGSRLAPPTRLLTPVGLLEPGVGTSGMSGPAVAAAVSRSAQPHASTSGATEKATPAPRWRAPLHEPVQAPVPSGASFAPATGGSSSGGGIPVFLALPFLAAMLDLARRVTLDRVALPSGLRSRMPEEPG